MSNLAANLPTTASRYPQLPAVRGDRRSWTYADLDEHSARVGGGLLAHGVRPGDRVTLVADDAPTLAALYYGVLRVGAVAVLVDPGLEPQAIRHRVDAAGARVVFAAEERYGPFAPVVAASRGLCVPVGPAFLDQIMFWPRWPTLVRRHGDEAAVVLWLPEASGGRGRAHSLELGHRTLRAAASRAVGDILALSPGDTLVTTTPIHSLVGQTCGLNATVLAGAGFVRIDSADAHGTSMEIHRSYAHRKATVASSAYSDGEGTSSERASAARFR
ncbi:AMP-binding protein [Streptomyces sp. NPDC058955]|uniref:AMP-binding protein n=1 Tax=unclassified Streptomyces TaxID=2593676 RepID=UPI003657C61F